MDIFEYKREATISQKPVQQHPLLLGSKWTMQQRLHEILLNSEKTQLKNII